MSRRHRPPGRSPTTILQLSGWLFADLLLALSVVFLAAIPGVPEDVLRAPSEPPTPTPTATGRPVAWPVRCATRAVRATHADSHRDRTTAGDDNSFPYCNTVTHTNPSLCPQCCAGKATHSRPQLYYGRTPHDSHRRTIA